VRWHRSAGGCAGWSDWLLGFLLRDPVYLVDLPGPWSALLRLLRRQPVDCGCSRRSDGDGLSSEGTAGKRRWEPARSSPFDAVDCFRRRGCERVTTSNKNRVVGAVRPRVLRSGQPRPGHRLEAMGRRWVEQRVRGHLHNFIPARDAVRASFRNRPWQDAAHPSPTRLRHVKAAAKR